MRPLLFLLSLPLLAQGEKIIRENYTKYEYRIAARDGKRLFTSVYIPKDQSQKWPILLNRTPYSVAPYGVDQYKADLGPNAELAETKYIFVYQDVRGRNMSEGEFVNMTPHKAVKRSPQDIDESSDTYDTIDWLVKNLPNNNGKVCTYGISYPGFYTAAGMIDAHPAHVCASPQAPITDWFTGDDFHRNGALYLPHGFNFLAGFGKPRPEPVVPPKDRVRFDYGTPDGYKFYLQLGPLYNANERYFKNTVAFWNEMMRHDTYDEFWQSRNLRPHLKAVKPAVMTVGGWFDAENLYGARIMFLTTTSRVNRLLTLHTRIMFLTTTSQVNRLKTLQRSLFFLDAQFHVRRGRLQLMSPLIWVVCLVRKTQGRAWFNHQGISHSLWVTVLFLTMVKL